MYQQEPGPQDGELTDGLYYVTTNYLCAGFVVEKGVITRCAPILRKNLKYWVTVAKLQCLHYVQ